MPVSKRGFDTKKRPEGSPQASQSSEFRVRRRFDHDFGETLEPSPQNYNHDTAKLEHADYVSKRCRMPSSQMIRYRNKQ